jgi:hypothetical protein
MPLILNDDLIQKRRATSLALCGAASSWRQKADPPAEKSQRSLEMERTRTPIDDLGVVASMTRAPVMANALLMANALAPQAASEKPAAPAESGPRGGERKRGLLDRLDNWFWTLEQRALEARLAEATDIYDLEQRMREIERGTPWWSH